MKAFALLILALSLLACSTSWKALPARPEVETPAPLATLASSSATTAEAPQPILPGAPPVWIAPSVPRQLASTLTLPPGMALVDDPDAAPLHVDVVRPGSPGAVPWIYALVAPFPTITDSVTLNDLQSLWRGEPVLGLLAQGVQVKALLVDDSTLSALTAQWGAPGRLVQTAPADSLIDRAWDSGETTWAIVPFERLEPRWKVIGLDGQSPVQKSFRAGEYGLALYFGLSGDPSILDALPIGYTLAASNRDPGRLTTVVLTGVTAMVRATASYMVNVGMTYPAKYIGAFLQEADILHINNEIPFAPDCPAPLPWEGLVFCSQERYIELLEYIGTDVVELSGDHFADWGSGAMLFTLDLYRQRGWPMYGGGANSAEAMQPALFDENGNRIAFLGCNAKPPGYATADDDTPGAVHCDMDAMVEAIQQVRADGYLPIVTFQHLEYYSYDPHPILQEDFARMAEAGAVIVSGSQAHQPHAMTFHNGAFLHYGLGNLFFDQLDEGTPTRQAFIDRHVFYDGRYISTELVTTWFVDYALSRLMTPSERKDLLRTVFRASGW